MKGWDTGVGHRGGTQGRPACLPLRGVGALRLGSGRHDSIAKRLAKAVMELPSSCSVAAI